MNSNKENEAKRSDCSDSSVKSKDEKTDGVKQSEVRASPAVPAPGAGQFRSTDTDSVEKEDIDAKRHPEEQNVDSKEYMPADKMSHGESPRDQRI